MGKVAAMKRAILINSLGKHEFEISLADYPAWIIHAGRKWGFGVAHLNGARFYFELTKVQRQGVCGDIV